MRTGRPPVRDVFHLPAFPWDLDTLPYVTLDDHDVLPPDPCLYFVRTEREVLYIGQTTNVSSRLRAHHRMEALASLPGPIAVAWLPLPHASKPALEALESLAIAHYHPILNRSKLPRCQHVDKRLAALFPVLHQYLYEELPYGD